MEEVSKKARIIALHSHVCISWRNLFSGRSDLKQYTNIYKVYVSFKYDWYRSTTYPSSTWLGFELMTSRSWQYTSCHWGSYTSHQILHMVQRYDMLSAYLSKVKQSCGAINEEYILGVSILYKTTIVGIPCIQPPLMCCLLELKITVEQDNTFPGSILNFVN